MTDSRMYERAMRRAMELSLLGPTYGGNPQVGAVILDKDLNIIAEGFHNGAGTSHAEVMALAGLSSVPDGATAVVTLEPCNHTGKTGPCAKALIEAGIKRVVYGAKDPGQESAGGEETLVAAGVEVVSGVLSAEIAEQQKIWLTAIKNNRPFITLKWAQSLDGRSAASDKSSKWITGSEARNHVHLMRSQLDAILVGTNTVAVDDPELTARKPDGTLYEHQPLRVVMGSRELSSSLRVFNSDAKTVQYKTHSIQDVLSELWKLEVRHLLVEGGATVISEFIKQGLFDEILVYQAPLLIGGSNVAVEDLELTTMNEAIQLSFSEVKVLGKDVLFRAVRSN